jgi:hypothetical protein
MPASSTCASPRSAESTSIAAPWPMMKPSRCARTIIDTAARRQDAEQSGRRAELSARQPRRPRRRERDIALAPASRISSAARRSPRSPMRTRVRSPRRARVRRTRSRARPRRPTAVITDASIRSGRTPVLRARTARGLNVLPGPRPARASLRAVVRQAASRRRAEEQLPRAAPAPRRAATSPTPRAAIRACRQAAILAGKRRDDRGCGSAREAGIEPVDRIRSLWRCPSSATAQATSRLEVYGRKARTRATLRHSAHLRDPVSQVTKVLAPPLEDRRGSSSSRTRTTGVPSAPRLPSTRANV